MRLEYSVATTEFTAIAEQGHAHFQPGVPYVVPCPQGSVFELLEHTASIYPDAVALDYFGQTWTYKRVRQAALRAAQALYDVGVRPGDTVSLALPNCPQHFIAFYGAMRLGAAVAALNPLAPAAQLKQQMKRHGGAVCVVWDKVSYKIKQAGLKPADILTVSLTDSMPRRMRAALRLPVDKAARTRRRLTGPVPSGTRSWDKLVRRSHVLAEDIPQAQASDIAVILHSSGTNGVPKSVPLTHANIRANVSQNLFWVWDLDRGAEVFYSLLPYFHAFGMCFMLCSAVAIGARQMILPTFDADLALQAHERKNVTFFVGVPPMFDHIEKRASEKGTDLSSIKFAVSGGMSLDAGIAERWEKATGGYIIEGYGMSETSPTICGSPLSAERRPGCLGLAFPNTNVRLVDPDDPARDVPDGEPGEILVRGPQVFSGYLDAPEENEVAFFDGWFRTGDIARNDDGFIYLVDRLKDVVITSGFNVFPSQVEDAIKRLTNAEDCVVVGLPSEATGEEVVAVVQANWRKPDLNRLRRTLELELPHYALPRQLHMVDEIPHSLIGKPERRKMREQLLAATNSDAGEIEPEDVAVAAGTAESDRVPVSDDAAATDEAVPED
ncbi:long-chain fatty acid--CoA ligase [Actinobaculum sp. 352]|nr:long-chain fatty acid--CoA ligase [Actinobaculum sp. 352]